MSKIINKVKSKFSSETKTAIKLKINNFRAYFVAGNLTALAKIYGSDKYGGHFYTPHYNSHFNKFRLKKIKLLEIGVGGYESPIAGADSLRMWKKFFPFGNIFSLDIYDKSKLEESRIKIFQGSQIDTSFLNEMCNEIGELDLIIDDGSHINEHVIKSFEFLFPKLKIGGIYVIEDTQTSYWEEYGGTSDDFNKEGTIYHYFKKLLDSLNHEEFMLPNYKKNYFDKHIISMHFYHNMIFIYKGINNEPSNYLKNNKRKNE